ncbi:bidirectional sugar transporter NEC1-like [Andrographis paniculata]|uniref:bidirectional sugar transporter NEC1-like n=1 Tax=Andrographis paniculata TaxID=175694 RepID=UPI0021E8CCC5|nr:bidirectional sugar transporter NEC1-like [Andrographis paniculata]
MALSGVQNYLAFIFGLLGNVISFLVFLAPMPTFYTICKKRTSEGFQSIPYSVAFFSASLLLYYAVLKTNAYMIVIINAIGCVIEVTYILIYTIYAPRKARIFTVKLFLLFNVGGLGMIMVVSLLVCRGARRVSVVGWACAIVNLAVFASPLSIMRRVIRTKSVEFMPFTLSLFLTLCATAWFFYGFFVRDYYIALPNVLGFLFGIAQMILYFVYKNAKEGAETNLELEPNKNIEKNVSSLDADADSDSTQ